MKWIVIAGILLASTSAHATPALPEDMMGPWSMANEEGNMERAPEGGDFYVAKDRYSGVDAECIIKEIEKLGQAYMVRAHCQIVDDAEHQWDQVVEFELRGNVMHMENVGG